MKNIGIVGLGLIGGSLAKSFRKLNEYNILGWDINNAVNEKALNSQVIDEVLSNHNIGECDILIISLYPHDTIEYIKNNYKLFKKGLIVMDTCGVKIPVCSELFPIGEKADFTFIGGHPMAGIEYSGFENSHEGLFDRASMILVPDDTSSDNAEKNRNINIVSELFLKLGFGKIEVTTADEHDKRIAYTSQLAHVVSSAYVKNPMALAYKGFSAGSFHDMTRVAKLNEVMWSQLFLDNKEYLIEDIDRLIKDLNKYKDAIAQNDKEELHSLLRDGRLIREELIQNDNR